MWLKILIFLFICSLTLHGQKVSSNRTIIFSNYNKSVFTVDEPVVFDIYLTNNSSRDTISYLPRYIVEIINIDSNITINEIVDKLVVSSHPNKHVSLDPSSVVKRKIPNISIPPLSKYNLMVSHQFEYLLVGNYKVKITFKISERSEVFNEFNFKVIETSDIDKNEQELFYTKRMSASEIKSKSLKNYLIYDYAKHHSKNPDFYEYLLESDMINSTDLLYVKYCSKKLIEAYFFNHKERNATKDIEELEKIFQKVGRLNNKMGDEVLDEYVTDCKRFKNKYPSISKNQIAKFKRDIRK